jgi:uncharacterized membrane protein
MRAHSHEAVAPPSGARVARMRQGAALLLKLAYPAVILGAWGHPRVAGCVLLAVLWLQRWLGAGALGAMLRKLSPLDWCVALGLSGASAGIALSGSEAALRCYPMLVNLGLLLSFGATLVRPPSMIERFARLRDAHPPPHVIRYTRRLTQWWCGFFLLNAIVSAYSAWRFSREAWAFYNGVLVYAIIGALIAVEWLWRRFVLQVNAPHAGETR